MSIKRRIILIIFFDLFIFIRLTNYISLELIEYDDCIMNITVKNDLYTITPNYIIYYNVQECYYLRYFDNSYEKGDFVFKNHEFNYNDNLEIYFGDSDHTEGWMQTNIYFNEYLIQTKDRVFWRCTNCENTWNNDYYTEDADRWYRNDVVGYDAYLSNVKEKIFFYRVPGNSTKDKLYAYHFYFIINNKEQLYNGGNDQYHNPFIVNTNYYSLGPENKRFEFTIYASQKELELINFNVSENFHVTGYNHLLAEYTDYYFDVEGYNTVEGKLKGLHKDNDNMHILDDQDHTFKVTDTTGLIYELSEGEIERKNDIYITIGIAAFNYCQRC